VRRKTSHAGPSQTASPQSNRKDGPASPDPGIAGVGVAVEQNVRQPAGFRLTARRWATISNSQGGRDLG
jgi:hypothetical protein